MAEHIPDNTESLIILLSHSDGNIREKAKKKLFRIDASWREGKETQKQLPKIIAALTNDDERVREGAASALGVIGDISAVEPLIAAMNEGIGDGVGKAAAKALGLIGDVKSVEPLIVKLKDGNRIGEAAAEALGQIGDRQALEPLIASLRCGNDSIQRAAKNALIRIDPLWPSSEQAQRQIPEFVKATGDKNESVRRTALQVLGLIGNVYDAGPIVEILRKDENENVRVAAAGLLGIIGDKIGVIPLISALEDSDRVRNAAIGALGLIGDARALNPVVGLWMKGNEDGDHMLMGLVQDALRRIRKSCESISDHYPNLLCSGCFRRPIKGITGVIHERFVHVLCPKCKFSATFIKGVRRVVGVIGGDTIELCKEGDTVTVPLWDEKNGKAQFADIDELVISEKGIENYHLAINAVIIELTSDSDKSKRLKKLPICLEGKPDISKDVKRMLKENFCWESNGYMGKNK